jgi:hypothetical protein
MRVVEISVILKNAEIIVVATGMLEAVSRPGIDVPLIIPLNLDFARRRRVSWQVGKPPNHKARRHGGALIRSRRFLLKRNEG